MRYEEQSCRQGKTEEEKIRKTEKRKWRVRKVLKKEDAKKRVKGSEGGVKTWHKRCGMHVEMNVVM